MDPLRVLMQMKSQLRRMRQETFQRLTEMALNINFLYGQTYIRFEAVDRLLHALLEQYRTAQNDVFNPQFVQEVATIYRRHQQQQNPQQNAQILPNISNLELVSSQAGSNLQQQHATIFPRRRFLNSDQIEEITSEEITVNPNGNSNLEGDQNRSLVDGEMMTASTSNSTIDDKNDESNNGESTINDEPHGIDPGTDFGTPSNEEPIDLSGKEHSGNEENNDVDYAEQNDEDAMPNTSKKVRIEEEEKTEDLDQDRVPDNFRCIVVHCDYNSATLLDMLAHVEHNHQLPVPKLPVVKAFHCKWPDCTRTSNHKQAMITHIRTIHFHLPVTMKEQRKQRIVDFRKPEEYLGSALD